MTHQSSIKFARHHACLFVALGLMGVGCAVGTEGEEDDMPELSLAPNYQTLGSGGTGGDPDTNNTLDDACVNFSGVVTTLQSLANGPIADADDDLPSMPYMPSGNSVVFPGCRREMLKVLVECALPGAHSYTTNGVLVNQPAITVKDGGDTTTILGYQYPRVYSGRHGLAPHWMNRALTEDEEEFVTACVMARTNFYGETVNILMEGHAPIAYDPDWRAEYPYAESTVWGNIFTSTRSMHVCHNTANGLCVDADKRVCDEDSNCNFNHHGDCLHAKAACSGVLGTPPSYCNAWPNKISVFLQQDDLKDSCSSPITANW